MNRVQFMTALLLIGLTTPSHCNILSFRSRSPSGQWVPNKRSILGENGESFSEINEWAHRKLYGHGLHEDFSDESQYGRAIGENDESFDDINNWAHQKLYGHKTNEDFSEESQEKIQNVRNGNDDYFDEIKDWTQRKIYSQGVNEISSQEYTMDREGRSMGAMGENNESFDVVNNWAHKQLYGHRADEDFTNDID